MNIFEILMFNANNIKKNQDIYSNIESIMNNSTVYFPHFKKIVNGLFSSLNFNNLNINCVDRLVMLEARKTP